MGYREDYLVGIRKARLASFVLLLTCFAALLVLFVLIEERQLLYIAAAVVIAVHVAFWWFVYRRILLSEAEFFEAVAEDMYAVHFRLRTFESAVRHISDGVVIVSEDDDIVLVNETAKRLFAAFDGDLDGSHYDEYAAGFSEKLERATILEAANESLPPETISVDGQYYKIGYVALVPEKGRWRGAVAVISDVTESTKADRMQSDFIANVSHELRTPLTSVKVYAETLRTGSVEEKGTEQEFLDIIVSEADRMNGLIKELMDLASTDYTELVLNLAESDLPTLVKTSIKKLSGLAQGKSIVINRMFDENMSLSVEMDRVRIEQVLINILNNAIKYTDEEGRVDVDIISGQNCVQIVITDDGIGIPEEDLARVFERFYRGDKARTGGIGGTGLGLAISKQIVEAHGGTIGIESKYGRGTTVTVTLPAGKGRGVPGIL